jgi:hypothetical protein
MKKEIKLKYLGYSDQYETLEVIKRTLSNGMEISVPIGWRTDMASTPRIVWWIFPPFGTYSYAAVVHDYLYMTPEIIVSRRFTDAEFRRNMIEDGTSPLVANIFYFFVSLFGAWNWRKFKTRGAKS